MSAIQVRRLGYACGAAVTGIDLREQLDDATLAAVRKAWIDNVVLCFPGQDLTPAQFMAFCGRFGPLDDNRSVPEGLHPEHPEVKYLSNHPFALGGKEYVGEKPGVLRWHSDQSYTDHPPTATFLLAKEMPEVGGDTMFANMYLAYETLSPGLKRILDGLDGVHDHSLSAVLRSVTTVGTSADKKRNPPVVHPAVRVHPESGRKALYVNPRVRLFAGMTEEESRPLLDYLNRHSVSYEFLYVHRWKVDDLVMWDNRCAMHMPAANFDRSRVRRLVRCMVRGPRSGAFYEPEASLASVPA